MPYKDKNKRNEVSKKCRRVRHAQYKAKQAEYRSKNRVSIREAARIRYYKNQVAVSLANKQSHLRLKYLLMKKYGGCCIYCRTKELAVLTIDHKNNDGVKERGKAGKHPLVNNFYRLLLNQPIRDDLQILCFNCQWRKRIYGGGNKKVIVGDIRHEKEIFAGDRRKRLPINIENINVKWIIQDGIFEECDQEKIIDSIKANGMAVIMAKYGFGEIDNTILKNNDCVVFYGSINCCRRLLYEHKWFPAVWMDLPNLRCSSYYAHWGHWVLQREYTMMPWGELPNVQTFLYERFGINDGLFVRPNENTKIFEGKVVAKDEFKKWYDHEEYCYSPQPESLCIVAKPQKIEAEWRIIICDGEIVTASQYKANGKLSITSSTPTGAIELAELLMGHEWQPSPTYCLDVCLVGNEYRIVEIGSVNCACLYKCEIDKVVVALSSLAERQWKDIMGE